MTEQLLFSLAWDAGWGLEIRDAYRNRYAVDSVRRVCFGSLTRQRRFVTAE
jgi:hypothetical protein